MAPAIAGAALMLGGLLLSSGLMWLAGLGCIGYAIGKKVA